MAQSCSFLLLGSGLGQVSRNVSVYVVPFAMAIGALSSYELKTWVLVAFGYRWRAPTENIVMP